MAYHVTQRRHEFGVRMALGATFTSVAGLTLRRAGLLAAIGIGIGLLPALLIANVVRSVMFGVVAATPALYVAVVAGILGIAFVASVAPARQAARVDPVTALRDA
jgi:ABC-type antimicrobial peptide transport system permease subunit